mmetsp:Transcript_6842/g.17063  ORF Transcript_6842/g.17063 Transcript_6842/m.17063 type:complete len:488 (-) Transcript_6842:174-1637(-)|eukprot:CAMPEP_0113478366 /NCGR_PEP_ID=MMETSP0014_2-20120614/20715_1 /TAXON_ID=2857 /ORGANISM="Nitzschia sp." /LENGTH=487 /DNA_ID=CAMNT_0000371547 /DNA_START=263 /DNA_END=1726 /DNA_ORIENTATION=- /assembly_acc=CAM_ASM_000159
MCRPTLKYSDPAINDTKKKIDEDNSKDNNDVNDETTRIRRRDQGFLYGTISLALVVTASTVMMGFAQSRRDRLGCDTVCVGGMTSARSTLALVGSTIVGKSSDSTYFDRKVGVSARQVFLVLGIVASAIELCIASQSDSLTGLWISLIPPALLQQNFNVLKALFGEYHDESATPAERAGSVGKLGMAAGLAFMAGPLLSSVVFNSYNDAAIFASACLVMSLWFVLQLPKPSSIVDKNTFDDNGKPTLDNNTNKSNEKPSWWSRMIPDLVPAARTPPALFIMSCRVCMSLSFHIFQTIWAVALKERFEFGPKDYGRYYSFIGFGFAISQGFLAKAVLKQFENSKHGRSRLLLICAMILGGGRYLAYQTNNIIVVYALFGLIIVALGLINTIFTADTSKIASPNELGGLFGVLASVESLAGIAGPILGGILSNQLHPVRGPLYAVITLYGIVFGLVYWRYEEIVMKGMMNVQNSSDDNIDKAKMQQKID